MSQERQHGLSRSDKVRVGRVVSDAERTSREIFNRTPIPGFAQPSTGETAMWVVKVGEQGSGSEELSAMYHGTVYLPAPVPPGSDDWWQSQDCWLIPCPDGSALTPDDYGMGRLIGFRPRDAGFPGAGKYDARPVYVIAPCCGASPFTPTITSRLMDAASYQIGSTSTWEDVTDLSGDVSIDLGPGTYIVTGTVCARAADGSGGASLTDKSSVQTRLYNSTDATTVDGSYLCVIDWADVTTGFADIIGGSASFTTTYTIASGTKTLKLQAVTPETNLLNLNMQVLGLFTTDGGTSEYGTHIRAIRIV